MYYVWAFRRKTWNCYDCNAEVSFDPPGDATELTKEEFELLRQASFNDNEFIFLYRRHDEEELETNVHNVVLKRVEAAREEKRKRAAEDAERARKKEEKDRKASEVSKAKQDERDRKAYEKLRKKFESKLGKAG